MAFIIRTLIALAILIGTNSGLHADEVKPAIYMVVFRLSVSQDGKLPDLQAVKVIDLLSGSNNPAVVELPPPFLDQARQKIQEERPEPTMRNGKPSSVLTSFIYSPTNMPDGPPAISFATLSGSRGLYSEFKLSGIESGLVSFSMQVGHSTFGVSYYALSLPKTNRMERAAIVAAELQRSLANMPDTEILERRDLSTESQTIEEFICRPLGNKEFRLRTRYICNDRQMLAFTAATIGGLSAQDSRAFDQLFEEFRFR